MLRSPHVKRIYLDELVLPADAPLGLSLLRLLSAPDEEVKGIVRRLVFKAELEVTDSELGRKAIELVEEVLLRRFTELDREEMRTMFQLHDLRKSKVWQEANREGREEGRKLADARTVRKCLAKGMSAKEISELLDMTISQVRRLAKQPDPPMS
ncbi:MAG: DUF2887 domain-containing protein [Planctomycetes bacterium]|nr:DUF2887 domain-containing protein [Planctomycetota bacterium]